eukprot:8996138-Alexandrium_andersonii.AAC.1
MAARSTLEINQRHEKRANPCMVHGNSLRLNVFCVEHGFPGPLCAWARWARLGFRSGRGKASKTKVGAAHQ